MHRCNAAGPEGKPDRMSQSPREILDTQPMSRLQIAAVAITIGLNALDGFDVLSISFASPGIAKEWGIDRAALGIVLSMELLGMAVGSIFLGGLADKIGRRPTMLGCLAVMALGMFMCTTADNTTQLSLWRVLTGLGIGGMLAAINAVAAEFSNAKNRAVSMALMVIGYPLGAVIGGSVAAVLLKNGDWRLVFEFGALITFAFIPLVWFFVPESVDYLSQRRPAGALERINAILRRFGHTTIASLPAVTAHAAKQSVTDILKPGLIATTLLLTLAYSAHVVTFYFILKWVPKIVTDMGFQASAAASVLVWANVGGALGGAIFGIIAKRMGLLGPTIFTLFASCVAVVLFGRGQADLTALSIGVFCTGLFTNSAIVGLYSLFADAFPTHVRATGTGFAIGAGRGGAALAPILAGYLFQWGYGLQTVAAAMAAGSFVAALCLIVWKQVAAPAK
jgi:benzoate transport